MASSSPNSGTTPNKIVVKGIPSNVSSDKLTIYFQKKKNVGGGDVQSVTFPISNKERNTAIITFEDPETVQSVLRYEHKIGGKAIAVSVLQPQPQIFDSVTAKISDYVIQKLKINSNVDDELERIMDCTGCNISPTGQGFTAEGEWYQVQAAFERIESIISESFEGKSAATENGYLSKIVQSSRPVTVTQSLPPVAAKRPQEVISTVIDKDMFAYMKLVHNTDLDDIKKKFGVDLSETVVGDASKIVLAPIATNADSQKARKALESLHGDVSNSAAQDIVKMDPKLPPNTAEKVLATLCPEFPTVHIAPVHDSRDTIIFTAPDKMKCDMAINMFKHFLKREQEEITRSTPASGDVKNDDKTKVSVDIDIFSYIELVRGDTLARIWALNGSKIETKTIGDCVEIRLRSSLSADRRFDPETAIDEFQKLYNRTQDEATQKTYNFKKEHGNVKENMLANAIRLTNETHKDVYVVQMAGDANHLVLFICDTPEKCKMAMEMFERLLGPKKR